MTAVHVIPPQSAARNAAAREKAAKKARNRATRLLDAARAPGPVEPVRLAPARRPGDDLTPRGAGEVDAGEWSEGATLDPTTGRRIPGARVRGYRTACILTRMSRRPGSRITEVQIRAADLARLAYDVARLGYSRGNELEPRAGGGTPGPRSDHGGREVARNRMARELERVLQAVGPSRADLFAAVVLKKRLGPAPRKSGWVFASSPRSSWGGC